ncbi:hypothetical protein N7519_004401 [Penicillium mononematosum]|uniref:uncharacterized protein n=1 Tax=Penicillium mononematosum TaxID=268346 RepID=UPI0025480CD3|nr:uncharacterized protein N7519_004401 [Penicillium mononematosum]KAJ6189493.1 hypothetical protein N7519_004401 [Penicillium mononematosum]
MADRIWQHYSLSPSGTARHDYVSARFRTLKALMLTKRTLCAFASSYVFCIISLYDENESCEAFKSIMHTRVEEHVRKLYLNTRTI